MKTEAEISAYLERQLYGCPTIDRPLYVAFGRGHYEEISSAVIEVEGSPTRGMAVIRGRCPLLDCDEREAEVWVLRGGNKMRHLRNGSNEAVALLAYAKLRLGGVPLE